jgi:hypothetical protein
MLLITSLIGLAWGWDLRLPEADKNYKNKHNTDCSQYQMSLS